MRASSRRCGPGGRAVLRPHAYTPKHLAEKILTSKSALEGERKQVTVLFADLKGSMELLADRDPEEARKILDPVLEHMMEAVHRYEGTVNQVMGDGIMALFGAPRRPRRSRGARLLRGAADAGRRSGDTPRRSAGPTASRCRSASGSTPATWSCDRSAATCGWTTRPSARRRTWPRAWSSWRPPGTDPPDRRDAAAGRRIRAGEGARADSRQGASPSPWRPSS